jgi:hypothetical protein
MVELACAEFRITNKCLIVFLWNFSPLNDQLQVTAEDMEAYRMKRVLHDDPMKDFLH